MSRRPAVKRGGESGERPEVDSPAAAALCAQAVRDALAEYFAAREIDDPEDEATRVLRHIADYARGALYFPESVTRALMALDSPSPAEGAPTEEPEGQA